MSVVELPEIMMDDETPSTGDRTWLRADGRTRGQAQAAISAEIGCAFTDLRLRREWLRQNGHYEREPGVPDVIAARPDDEGATLYFVATLVALR